MIYLLVVSLIWAFSFGLIKGSLTGLDANLVSLIRLAISFVFFLPVMKIKGIKSGMVMKLILAGTVQYGLMYSLYIYSYRYLEASEVALFTIFTPVFVTLFNDLFNRKFNGLFLATSLLAVAGAIVIYYYSMGMTSFIGILLVQASNLCFAFGQIYYRRIMKQLEGYSDRDVFGLLYLGAVVITLIFSSISVDFEAVALSSEQVYILLYLGIVASGIGFFLWNYGARRTNAGALSIFNNLKIPLAMAVSYIFFSENINSTNLIVGGIIIVGSLLLNQYFLTRKNESIIIEN